MGGDGGTISSNRTYLRGAGKACHTADHPSNALRRSKLEDAERARLVLGMCAASGAALDFSPSGGGDGGGGGTVSGADVVACPHGKLYRREKALEALLRRSRTGGGEGDAALGWHIRGMKDLHPVRFHVTKAPSSRGGNGGGFVPACPITGSEIASGNVPSFLIVCSKLKDKKKAEGEDEAARNPNVLSERAVKEMGLGGLQTEYGPFEERNMIRLAPPRTGGVFEEIQRKWETRMEEERIAKLKKKKDKKRKRGDDEDVKRPHAPTAPPTKASKGTVKRSNSSGGRADPTKNKSVVDEARSTVQFAVSQNPVLSNLFGAGKKNRSKSEKQRSIDLFTRNC